MLLSQQHIQNGWFLWFWDEYYAFVEKFQFIFRKLLAGLVDKEIFNGFWSFSGIVLLRVS
jgi:hypothetical protein